MSNNQILGIIITGIFVFPQTREERQLEEALRAIEKMEQRSARRSAELISNEVVADSIREYKGNSRHSVDDSNDSDEPTPPAKTKEKTKPVVKTIVKNKGKTSQKTAADKALKKAKVGEKRKTQVAMVSVI